MSATTRQRLRVVGRTPEERRQVYVREWCRCYKGDQPFIRTIQQWVTAHPDIWIPTAAVEAVVRYSINEKWKHDPRLQNAVARQLKGATRRY